MGEDIIPHNNDVLLGRGGKNNQHMGNEQLRNLARCHAKNYRTASKKEKSVISSEIVFDIRNLNPPGRFLKRVYSTNRWEDVGDDVAREKARQAMRDAVSAQNTPQSYFGHQYNRSLYASLPPGFREDKVFPPFQKNPPFPSCYSSYGVSMSKQKVPSLLSLHNSYGTSTSEIYGQRWQSYPSRPVVVSPDGKIIPYKTELPNDIEVRSMRENPSLPSLQNPKRYIHMSYGTSLTRENSQRWQSYPPVSPTFASDGPIRWKEKHKIMQSSSSRTEFPKRYEQDLSRSNQLHHLQKGAYAEHPSQEHLIERSHTKDLDQQTFEQKIRDRHHDCDKLQNPYYHPRDIVYDDQMICHDQQESASTEARRSENYEQNFITEIPASAEDFDLFNGELLKLDS